MIQSETTHLQYEHHKQHQHCRCGYLPPQPLHQHISFHVWKDSTASFIPCLKWHHGTSRTMSEKTARHTSYHVWNYTTAHLIPCLKRHCSKLHTMSEITPWYTSHHIRNFTQWYTSYHVWNYTTAQLVSCLKLHFSTAHTMAEITPQHTSHDASNYTMAHLTPHNQPMTRVMWNEEATCFHWLSRSEVVDRCHVRSHHSWHLHPDKKHAYITAHIKPFNVYMSARAESGTQSMTSSKEQTHHVSITQTLNTSSLLPRSNWVHVGNEYRMLQLHIQSLRVSKIW